METEQEIDLWWGGYAGMTMLPHFLLSCLVSVAVILAAWFHWEEEREQLLWHTALFLVTLAWLAPFVLAGYRSATDTYRLTTRRLCRDRGLWRPAHDAMLLEHVGAVSVECGFWERLVGVGRVKVVSEDGVSLVLEGVRDPHRVAKQIHCGVQCVREQRS